MTRITPLRLMIWQNSHLRFTEALTFMFLLQKVVVKKAQTKRRDISLPEAKKNPRLSN